MIHEGHNKCKTNNVTNEKIFIYYKNLNVCVCVCVCLDHFLLLYLTLYPKRNIWCRIAESKDFYSSSDPHIYRLSIYTLKRRKTHKKTIYMAARNTFTVAKSLNMLMGNKMSHKWWWKLCFYTRFPTEALKAERGSFLHRVLASKIVVL